MNEAEWVIEQRIQIDDEWLERLIAHVAVALGVPAVDVTNAVTAFIEAETDDLQLLNNLMALGVHLRPGGPDDGADA